MPGGSGAGPGFARPRLRFFLSLDLVGSTAIKQRGVFPLAAPDEAATAQDQFASWFSPIAAFFHEVGFVLADAWTRSEQGDLPPPRPWKANGDEIIYVGEVRSGAHAAAMVCCWLVTLARIRSRLRTRPLSAHGLDVKGTIWAAGFPIANSEIVLQRRIGLSQQMLGYHDHVSFENYRLLEERYAACGAEEPEAADLDFLGPGIDTGFRLAERATPRQLVISADIAYILSLIATTQLDRQVARHGLTLLPHYAGRQPLRGVLGGRPYPIFWIDTANQSSLESAEDDLVGRKHAQWGHVLRYCEAFFAEHEPYLIRPFIDGCAEPASLGLKPDHYDRHTANLARWYEDEKAKRRGEDESLLDAAGRKAPGRAVSAASARRDIMEFAKKLSFPGSEG